MKKIQLFLLMLLGSCLAASAQSMEATGKVTYSDDGTAVVGATVRVQGTLIVALSDINGAYKITIPSGATKVLEISFTGMKTVVVQVPQNGIVDASMDVDNTLIDEVVVTAYGNTTKKAFTGTASVVKAEDIKNLQISSASQALQGLATGVIAVSNTGQPGENPTIRVRGVGSLSTASGAGDPLIVVDGITYNGNLNTIPSQDIASMTVLKDANSTALYGSRAANGVIMVTTKSGVAGKTRVNASVSYGMSSRARKDYEYLNAAQYLELGWTAFRNSAQYTDSKTPEVAAQWATDNMMTSFVYNPYGNNPSFANPVGVDGKTVAGAQLLYDENWYDALTQTGVRQSYDVQVSGGDERTKWLFSVNALDEAAIIQSSKFIRYGARSKVDSKITPWLSAGINNSISYSDQNYPLQSGSATSGIISFSRMVANIYPAYVRNADGSLWLDERGNTLPDYGNTGIHPGQQIGTSLTTNKRPVASNANPLGTTTLNDISTMRFINQNNGYVEASFLNDFKFRTQLGVEFYLLNASQYYNPLYGDGVAYKGISSKDQTLQTTITFSNTLTYDKSINEKHHINVLVGTESYDFKYKYFSAARSGFDFPGVSELDYANTVLEANSSSTANRSMRYLSRVAYDFSDRYHISASFTLDGTSRFAEGHRWGKFYSVGGAWNISNESFFQNSPIVEWFSDLKLKASYGATGNSNIGFFPYMATYSGGHAILDYGGSVIGSLANENLSWESQLASEVGIEMSFLKHRLNASVTYYSRVSDKLLMRNPLPLSTGMTGYNDNIGKMKNSGVEIELSGIIMRNRDFDWSAGFNIASLKNEVKELPEGVASTGMNSPLSGSKRLVIGESAYTWFLQDFAGIDPANGLPLWYVGENREETTPIYGNATRYLMGDALPKLTGGFNTRFSWKGIELGIITSFSIGGKILDTDKAGLMHGFVTSRTGYQVSADAYNAWKNPGDITDVAMLTRTETGFNSISSRWLVNASYMRLRNMTIGYDLARLEPIKDAGIRSLRVFCAMDNLVTLFGTKGLDPEQGLGAVTNNSTSAMKTISFGLSIGL